MKFYISLAANVVLSVVLFYMGYQMLARANEDSNYRKLVGSIAASAVKDIDNGQTKDLRGMFAAVPSEPDFDALVVALQKAGGPSGPRTPEPRN